MGGRPNVGLHDRSGLVGAGGKSNIARDGQKGGIMDFQKGSGAWAILMVVVLVASVGFIKAAEYLKSFIENQFEVVIQLLSR